MGKKSASQKELDLDISVIKEDPAMKASDDLSNISDIFKN